MPTICVKGRGKITRVPDLAVITVGIRVREKDREASKARGFRIFNALAADLSEDFEVNLLLEKADTETVREPYDRNNPEKLLRVLGYDSHIIATVEVDMLNRDLKGVLAAISRHDEANYHCKFTLQAMEEAKALAVADAVAKARSIAEVIATAGGLSVKYAESIAYGMSADRGYSKYGMEMEKCMAAPETPEEDDLDLTAIADVEVQENVEIIFHAVAN